MQHLNGDVAHVETTRVVCKPVHEPEKEIIIYSCKKTAGDINSLQTRVKGNLLKNFSSVFLETISRQIGVVNKNIKKKSLNGLNKII